jgi:hypothetical protein
MFLTSAQRGVVAERVAGTVMVTLAPGARDAVVQIIVAWTTPVRVFVPFVQVHPPGGVTVPMVIYGEKVSVTTTPVAAAVPVLVMT